EDAGLRRRRQTGHRHRARRRSAERGQAADGERCVGAAPGTPGRDPALDGRTAWLAGRGRAGGQGSAHRHRPAAGRAHRAGDGIGIERILAGAVELHHDGDGIRMPMSIAPLHVALLPLQMQDGAVRDAAERLYRELTDAGVEVLLDDRDERAGVKFKDADLIGLPVRLALGKKGLAEAKAEWKLRGSKDLELVPLSEVAAKAADAIRAAGGKLPLLP